MKSAIYDFLFETEVWCTDSTPWPPLEVQIQGTPVKVHKPIAHQASQPVPDSIGNQGLDIYSTILRLELSSETPPAGDLLYPIAVRCLSWIRVLTRQYWVGFSGSGTAAVRGSSLISDLATGVTEPANFGGFRTPIIPQPLSQEVWTDVGRALVSADSCRNSDLIFCNGMLALRNGSLQESIALLGIACEVELTEYLQSFVLARNDPVISVLYKQARTDFKSKLTELLPALCGRKFSDDVPHWHPDLLHLYKLRGTAAHGTLGAEDLKNVPRFVLAADSFLRWMHEIRSACGERVGPSPLSVRATVGPVV
jgi:hypothetical protein